MSEEISKGDTITVVCMDCGKTIGTKSAEGAGGGISHGLCSDCSTKRKEKLEEFKKKLLGEN